MYTYVFIAVHPRTQNGIRRGGESYVCSAMAESWGGGGGGGREGGGEVCHVRMQCNYTKSRGQLETMLCH